MDHHQHNNNNQHGHHDLQQQHHIGHQYVHSHPLTHHQQSTTSYYQSNVIDPYMVCLYIFLKNGMIFHLFHLLIIIRPNHIYNYMVIIQQQQQLVINLH